MNTLHLIPSSLKHEAHTLAALWQRLQTRLAQAWKQAAIGADERYIADATDLADLERRLGVLNRSRDPLWAFWR